MAHVKYDKSQNDYGSTEGTVMTFQIEFREEVSTLISTITAQPSTDHEIGLYLDEVVRLQNIAIQNRAPRLYHIVVIEPHDYSLARGLGIIRAVQQNKGLRAIRKQIDIMIILVGQTSKSLQIMVTMMTQNAAGERQVAVFPTLDAALAFVYKNNASLRDDHQAE